MSDAITTLFPEDQEMAHLSKFVRDVANGFQTMNSKGETSKRMLAHGYGIHLQEQEEALKQLKELALNTVVMNPANTKRKAENEKVPVENEKITKENLTAKRKRKLKQIKEYTLQPWQKSAGISCNSMLHLFHDLKKQYPDIRYIRTTRLNQDVCENLFSVLREMGRNDRRMGPLAFKERLRNYILTGGHQFFSTNTNVKEAEKTDELLIAEITKNLVDEATYTSPEMDDDFTENVEDIEVDVIENVLENVSDSESDEGSDSEVAEQEGFKNMAEKLEKVLLSPRKQSKKATTKSSASRDNFQSEDFIANSESAKLSKEDILPYIREWDEVFRKYHKEAPEGEHGLLRIQGVIKGFQLELMKDPKIPPSLYPLVKEFAHMRTIARLKHLKDLLKSNIEESARSKNLQNYWKE